MEQQSDRAAAEAGDADAMVALALRLEEQVTGYDEQDDVEAEVERWLLTAAETGHLGAAAELGLFLWHVREDDERARPWLERAAAAGNATAMAALGLIHDFLGEADLAVRWLSRAADLGDAHAAADLAALRGFQRPATP